MKKALVLMGLVTILSVLIVGVASATITSKSEECPYNNQYHGCE
ncbi:hypothetical protein [Tumebacillus amylolyticus]|nr:hypothetical protein [Tumebacillus amylolyticus]